MSLSFTNEIAGTSLTYAEIISSTNCGSFTFDYNVIDEAGTAVSFSSSSTIAGSTFEYRVVVTTSGTNNVIPVMRIKNTDHLLISSGPSFGVGVYDRSYTYSATIALANADYAAMVTRTATGKLRWVDPCHNLVVTRGAELEDAAHIIVYEMGDATRAFTYGPPGATLTYTYGGTDYSYGLTELIANKYCGPLTASVVKTSGTAYGDPATAFTIGIEPVADMVLATTDPSFAGYTNWTLRVATPQYNVFQKGYQDYLFMTIIGDCMITRLEHAEFTGFTYALGSGPIEIVHEPKFKKSPPCPYADIVTSRWVNGSDFDPCCVNFTFTGTKMIWTVNVTNSKFAGMHEVQILYRADSPIQYFTYNTWRWWLKLRFIYFPSTNIEKPKYVDETLIPKDAFRMKIGDKEEVYTGPASIDTALVEVKVVSKTPWDKGFIAFEIDQSTHAVTLKISPKTIDFIGSHEVKIILYDNSGETAAGRIENELEKIL